MRIQATICTAGQHGYTPPLDQIERTVVGWLPNAIRKGVVAAQVDPNAVNSDEPLQFGIRVECYRRPAGNFYGVQAVRILNDTVVEIRVRPPKYQWQFPANLICPSTEIMMAILGHCRPEAILYLARQYVEGQSETSSGTTSTCGIRYTPPSKRAVRGQEKLLRDLCHEHTREAFAHLLREELHTTQRTSLDEATVVRLALAAANRHGVDTQLARSALIAVVDTGILDPVACTKGAQQLQPTVILDELADRHVDRLRAEERQQLERQVTSASKLLEASQREVTRLNTKITEEHSKQARLDDQIATLKQQIEALTPTDEM